VTGTIEQAVVKLGGAPGAIGDEVRPPITDRLLKRLAEFHVVPASVATTAAT